MYCTKGTHLNTWVVEKIKKITIKAFLESTYLTHERQIWGVKPTKMRINTKLIEIPFKSMEIQLQVGHREKLLNDHT